MSSTTSLKLPADTVPVPAVAAVGVDEYDGGRVSRESNVSATSWEFESFQWNSTAPGSQARPLAAKSEREASSDSPGIAKASAPPSSNVPKFTSGLMERRGMEVENLDGANFVNVISIGGMSQSDPVALGTGWGVDPEELLGSSLEGECGSVGINGWKDDPKSKEEGKKSSAAKRRNRKQHRPLGLARRAKGTSYRAVPGRRVKKQRKRRRNRGRKRVGGAESAVPAREPRRRNQSRRRKDSQRKPHRVSLQCRSLMEV